MSASRLAWLLKFEFWSLKFLPEASRATSPSHSLHPGRTVSNHNRPEVARRRSNDLATDSPPEHRARSVPLEWHRSPRLEMAASIASQSPGHLTSPMR